MPRVQVLVLLDRAGELPRISAALDTQTLDYGDFAVTYLAHDPESEDLRRLDELCTRRPNVGRVDVVGGDWSTAVQEAVEQVPADYVVVFRCGERPLPEALERLNALAPDHDVVLGRRSGQPLQRAADASVGVAVALSSADIAKSAAATPETRGATADWLTDWHAALLGQAQRIGVLADYPVLAALASEPSDALHVHELAATWEGAELVLMVTLSAGTAHLAPTLGVRGPQGLEFLLPTTITELSPELVQLSARLHISSAASGRLLADGDWTCMVQATAPGPGAYAALPKTSVTPALIHGRPVVSTLRGSDLVLQVGVTRRKYFRADAERATITESVAGVELRLPLTGLHVAETERVSGTLLLGGLKVPAEVRAEADGEAHLQAWLSGLAGRYPLSVRFGHVHPVPLGLTLEIDGVGAMALVPTSASARAVKSPPASSAGAGGAPSDHVIQRIRRGIPEPLMGGLRRLPALRRWYAGRLS